MGKGVFQSEILLCTFSWHPKQVEDSQLDWNGQPTRAMALTAAAVSLTISNSFLVLMILLDRTCTKIIQVGCCIGSWAWGKEEYIKEFLGCELGPVSLRLGSDDGTNIQWMVGLHPRRFERVQHSGWRQRSEQRKRWWHHSITVWQSAHGSGVWLVSTSTKQVFDALCFSTDTTTYFHTDSALSWTT